MRQSKSYLLFRESIQDIFSFAVIVTAGVPVLKQTIKIYREGKIGRLPDADYFQPSVVFQITEMTLQKLVELGVDTKKIEALAELKNRTLTNNEFKMQVVNAIGHDLYKKHRNTLKKQSLDYIDNLEHATSGYQKKLATYLYFSAFSYFEAYIIDLAKEVTAQFIQIDPKTYLANHSISQDLINNRSKLIKPHNPSKEDRYKKFSKLLKTAGYQTPAELLFSSSLQSLNEKINDLKANDIPVFLEKIFLYKMPDLEKQVFHSMRDNRNSIGHGDKAYIPNLSDVIEANKFFKKISAEIDNHVVFHFFQLPNFRP